MTAPTARSSARTTTRHATALVVLAVVAALLPGLVAGSSGAAPARTYAVGADTDSSSTEVGEPVRLTGVVTPRAAGQLVTIQRAVSGKWRTLGQARLSASSRFSARVTFNSPAVERLRVVKPGKAGVRRGVSRVVRVRVDARVDQPVVATTTLPDGVVGTAYSTRLRTADERAGTWSIGNGSLPAGLRLAPATGVVSGTPTAAGAPTFTVFFRDRAGDLAQRRLTLKVETGGTSPEIETASLPDGTVGTAYTAQLETADDRAGTWSVTTGALPAGLTLAPATGAITGQPTTAGTATFTVSFRDEAARAASKALSITVQAAPSNPLCLLIPALCP